MGGPDRGWSAGRTEGDAAGLAAALLEATHPSGADAILVGDGLGGEPAVAVL